jgi:hypothetical protein
MHAVTFTERLRLCNRLSFADLWGCGSCDNIESVLAFTWRQVDAAHARGPLLPFLCNRMPRAIVMHWKLLCSTLPFSSSSPSSIRWILDVQLRDVLCAHYRHAARTMVPFAPGVAALRESVKAIKELIDVSSSSSEDSAFAVEIAEILIGLVLTASQAANGSLDNDAAAAALVSQNLKLLADFRLPEQPVSFADAESYILILQVDIVIVSLYLIAICCGVSFCGFYVFALVYAW